MRALIVLGGDLPSPMLLKRCASCAELTIAADRGLEAFEAAGVLPDLLLGDMDSVSAGTLARREGSAPAWPTATCSCWSWPACRIRTCCSSTS